ncbi:MAG: MBL fold metallo-hydrolase [Fibrobacterales bacterium]|nr:MBL fold metallo-hydrolase [Fibrobacterales bacterium]
MAPEKTLLAAALCAASAFAGPFAADTVVAPNGEKVVFSFVKHGTLMVEAGGKVVHVDPVAEYGARTDYSALPAADLLIVTHEHPDHFDPQAIALATKKETALVANARVVSLLGKGRAMANGDEAVVAGIGLKAVPAYNVTPGRERFHPKGRDNGFVLEFGGLRVYVSGDTEEIPAMDSLGRIDVAFLAANQPYTMTVEQCVGAARRIRPKILYPYHFGDTDVGKIAEALKGSGIEVRLREMR